MDQLSCRIVLAYVKWPEVKAYNVKARYTLV